MAENLYVTGEDVGVHIRRGGTLRNSVIWGGVQVGDPPRDGN